MCGIVGFAGQFPAKNWLIEGLHRLEYRGYDSAGVALVGKDGLDVVCRVGKVRVLEDAVSDMELSGTVGLGHTRWATHGKPSEENAHPHTDCTGRIAVVHNGIIENYQELKEGLIDQGHVFRSETDTEVIAHLIENYYEGGLLDAVRKAVSALRGSFGLAALSADEPDIVVVTRRDSPIAIASRPGQCAAVASDITALVDTGRDVVFLNDDEFAVLHKSGTSSFFDRAGREISPKCTHIDWNDAAADRMGFADFMDKEIHEQPRTVRDTLAGRFEGGRIRLDEFKLGQDELKSAGRLVIVACGTSYHAGLFARRLIERWARMPVSVELASEFRYGEPILGPDTLVLAITQSGETADTLAAERLAHELGSKVLAITNVKSSSIARESDGVLFTQAGREICVAATKSFIAQLVAVSCLALYLGQARGHLSETEVEGLFAQLEDTAPQIERILANDREVRRAATACVKAHSMMFIGRGAGAVTCYEGALKLKEISYLHAEAYAAGEIKHGPIALIDESVPVLAVALQNDTYDKVISNIEELRSRDARIVAVATEGDEEIRKHADYVIYIPKCADCFSPITASVPLQLFARYIALARGRDVDQPRNLAKSVTTE